ncbi:Rv3235 family protein [Streptomyces gobiensis]|uniref:Rv3235 family protein n=1 Tax=Streptomyces gobiensis TaxID=2875706 RepID=UPI001E31551E|nr:Rv3235 family protein [Streptomyces gobiensis]UGY91735.1 Rv3235 family protein [Streptomyces gobiensis]
MTTAKGPTRPPGRHDSRRPSRSAVLAAQRGRQRGQPHHWFAQRLLLVLSGQRPVHILLGHTSGPAYDQLTRLAPLAPLRADPAVRPSPTPVLGHVGYCAPQPGTVEVYACIRAGERTRALAFRLEHGPDRRWRCAAVELDVKPDSLP